MRFIAPVVGAGVMTEQLTFGDDTVIVCYGGAKPTDLHLLSTIRAVDNEIFEFLKRRRKGNAMTELNDEDERKLQREAFVENMKGPKGRGSYVPLPPTAEETAWREAQQARQEVAKRPPVLPPRTEIDFIEQRRQQLEIERRHERLKGL